MKKRTKNFDMVYRRGAQQCISHEGEKSQPLSIVNPTGFKNLSGFANGRNENILPNLRTKKNTYKKKGTKNFDMVYRRGAQQCVSHEGEKSQPLSIVNPTGFKNLSGFANGRNENILPNLSTKKNTYKKKGTKNFDMVYRRGAQQCVSHEGEKSQPLSIVNPTGFKTCRVLRTDKNEKIYR